MRKTHYIRQKFLVQDDSYGFDLDKITLQDFDDSKIQNYGTERNLFDFDAKLERKIKSSEFDKMIDTEKEFDDFARKLGADNVLFVEDDRPKVENPVYKDFSRLVFKNLAAKLCQKQIECRIYSNQSDNHRRR